MSEVKVIIRADVSRFIKAINEAARAMAEITRLHPRLFGVRDVPHRPRPLPIDGHAYRRRIRNRRKRR